MQSSKCCVQVMNFLYLCIYVFNWKLVPVVGLVQIKTWYRIVQIKNITNCAKIDLICWISAYRFRAIFYLNCIGLINLNGACGQLCCS